VIASDLGENGTFEVGPVGPGRYELRVFGRLLVPLQRQEIEVGHGEILSVDLPWRWAYCIVGRGSSAEEAWLENAEIRAYPIRSEAGLDHFEVAPGRWQHKRRLADGTIHQGAVLDLRPGDMQALR
jgi:hypothetical protein